MTDVIDRVHGGSVDAFREFELSPPSEARETGTPAQRVGPLQVFLAVVLGCSGILLLANVSHLSGWRAGSAMALAWIQVVLAIASVIRRTRAIFAIGALASLLGVGTWLSTHNLAAIPKSVLLVGVVLTGCSFLTALLLTMVPSLGGEWPSSARVLASVVPVGVIVITAVALFVAPTTPVVRATSAPQSFAAASAALALKTTVPVPGQNSKQFQQILAGNASEQTELKPYVPLDAADQTVLTQQLSQALAAAEKFPTVASAKAAGMILAGGMAPGVGAHYQVIGASDLTSLNGQFNPSEPASWIYASTADNAPIVGVMYESLTAQPPAGFIGPNDHWHQHANVCVKFDAGEIAVPFAADQNVTPQECSDVHGTFMKKTVWMVHAWVVPGWDSPQGVFSHDNLHVYCPGNTDLVDAIGFCTRQQ